MNINKIVLFLLIFFIQIFGCLMAQVPQMPELPAPDERFKSDILLVVAHPDDETAIGSYLAKAIFDDKKEVAIIYLNRGDGGGNTRGNEQSMAMANIREIEVRQATAKFGIDKVWILNGMDTPGQDVFQSLQNAGHGQALEKIVRLIRLTRPEVIFTWMPIYVSGENHGDHQAAAVLATEAFDLAGDPTVFSTQVTFPRDRWDIANFQEGLQPWQPKKLYYFSDRKSDITAPGPAFDLKAISKTKKIPYYKLAAQLHTTHLVQGEVATAGITAIESDDFADFMKWVSKYRLVFGKSIVPCEITGNVFDGITSTPHSFVRPSGYKKKKYEGISIESGGVFEFYRKFCEAHDVAHIAKLLDPEVMIGGGSYLHFPLLLRNNSHKSIEIVVTVDVPEGWNHYAGRGRYLLKPDGIYPVQTMVQAPWEESTGPVAIKWEALHNGESIGNVTINVDVVEWNLPQ